MKISLRIISSSYRTSDTVLEIFGRTIDGTSVTVLCGGFYPYFDVIEPNEQEIEGIKKNQEFKRMENLELWVKGETRKAIRIYVKHPYKVPELRSLFASYRVAYYYDLSISVTFIWWKCILYVKAKYSYIRCEIISCSYAFNIGF